MRMKLMKVAAERVGTVTGVRYVDDLSSIVAFRNESPQADTGSAALPMLPASHGGVYRGPRCQPRPNFWVALSVVFSKFDLLRAIQNINIELLVIRCRCQSWKHHLQQCFRTEGSRLQDTAQ